jgi:anti-sigma regulatory factor (Ser/Thr protein kinase)
VSELNVEAKTENVDMVIEFVNRQLDSLECPMKVQTQIDIAVEELFVNIANYAYSPEIGSAIIRMEVQDEPLTVFITFIDMGMPYNPLAKEDPDISLSAEERGIGGLGIYMVKKSMDDITYEYSNGQNILQISKKL